MTVASEALAMPERLERERAFLREVMPVDDAVSLLRRIAGEESADKNRLDFLDGMNTALNARYGTTYRWELILNHNINRLMLGHMIVDLNDAKPFGLRSCRVAIDREMERIRDARAARAASLPPVPQGGENG